MALDSSRRRDFLILAAERQERERQIGADTSKGYFMSDATDMNQYNGDRSFQMVVRAGEDVQSRQALRDAEPLGFVINDGNIYINLLGMWVCGYSVNANTTYHVVATFNKATMRAKLYVAGAFVSESKPRETEATYSSYFSIGNNRSANNPVYPFQGAIMLNRDFDYELTAEEVMSLDHNGDPAGYVLPGGMKYRGLSYESNFSKDVDGWKGNSAETTVSHIDGGLSVTGTSTEYQMNRNNQVTPSIAARYNVHIEFVEPTPTDATILFVAYSGGTGASKLISTGTTSVDLITPINSSLYRFSYLYFRGVTPGTVFKIKSISVKPAGCIAEYLPQNISLCPNNPANTRRFMSPMSADKWNLFQDGTPEISDGAIKCYFLAPGNNYKGGIACNLSPDQPFFTINSFVTLTLKAKCDIDGQRIIAGLGRGRGYIYVNRRIELTTEWVEYSLSAKSLASYEGGLNTIVLYPIYNQGGVGAYYIKDVQVVEEPGIAHAWLDSAKQLPLNDEYLPPLLGPIVIGDATPVNITGNNSYTWTGVDDPVYSRNITTSRRPTLGQWYRIVGSISGYEKGYPYISADTGYTEVALPRTDGPFSVLVQCKSAAPSSYYFSYRAGNRGTDRTLTITVDSIEPVVERGCDLTANGTPEIVYKTK